MIPKSIKKFLISGRMQNSEKLFFSTCVADFGSSHWDTIWSRRVNVERLFLTKTGLCLSQRIFYAKDSFFIDHVPIFNGFLTPPIMMFGLGRPFSYSMAAADELKKGSSNELRQKRQSCFLEVFNRKQNCQKGYDGKN